MREIIQLKQIKIIRPATLLLAIMALLIVLSGSLQAKVSRPKVVNTTTIQEGLSSEAGLNFTMEMPQFSTDGNGRIQVNGLEQMTTQPGAPELPHYVTYIAVPPEAAVSVSIQPSETTKYDAAIVQPAQKPDSEAMAGMEIPDFESPIPALPMIREMDTAVYNTNALYPTELYTLSEPMYFRDLRVVKLQLFPIRYNPVAQQLQQHHNLHVNIKFSGARLTDRHPIANTHPSYQKTIAPLVLNYDQAQEWRSLPQDIFQTPASELPIGVDTYKIEVTEDGIYEIAGAELAAQGMNIGSIAPNNIEMMHRGNPVAYQFVDMNSNGNFDSDDKIRFYGWAFDGPRSETQYIDTNVFWLWANGTATKINSVPNEAGQGYSIANSFPETVHLEEENHFFVTATDGWAEYDNDPDSYYWDYLSHQANVEGSWNYNIDLPFPVPGATGNTYLVELLTRDLTLTGYKPLTYTVNTFINNSVTSSERTWVDKQDINIVGTIDGNGLTQTGDANYPSNEIRINSIGVPTNGTDPAGHRVEYYLNRITVEYERYLTATDNELIFGRENFGQTEFQLAGFNEGSAANVIVWDISNRLIPQSVDMQAGNIQDDGGTFTYKIGQTHANEAAFIATTQTTIKSVNSISSYTPPAIDPSGSGADWIALTHTSFNNAATNLANYRDASMDTLVVDIEDVINQYGFGFHHPPAIVNFLSHATANWTTAPSYVTLIGHATLNPRNLDCPEGTGGCSSWDKDEQTFIVTHLSFTDRFNGLVPSDHIMTLLSGDDLLSDIALGRIPAKTNSEAQIVIDKIINYEQNLLSPTANWKNNILFVADDTDSGGDFCTANATTGTLLPNSVNQIHLCLPEPTVSATDALRIEMGNWINDVGISVLNYRGHGSLSAWADTSSSPALLSTGLASFWLNSGKPVAILSADCLDGFFAFPSKNALGETFLKLEGVGSAAHWSSSGIGYTSEHSILHREFYKGVYDQGLYATGDAVTYSKMQYEQSNSHKSEIWSFILLGDPAMQIVSSVAAPIYLPVIMKP